MSLSRCLCLIASAVTSYALAQTNFKTNPTETLTSQDRKFIDNAVKREREEVDLGHLAVDRGSDPSVKQFGQKMIDDHSKINQQLEKIASDKGVSLPKEGHSYEYGVLQDLNGADFDRAYKTEMVKDHQKDISEFQKEANGTQDPDLRQFTDRTLPTVQSYLSQAKALKP